MIAERRSLIVLVVLAGLLRLTIAAATAHEEADLARYRAVGRHVLDVSWNPYQAPRLYPYPPIWVWAEAGSELVARRTGAPFALVVKLPVIAGDTAIVALLGVSAGLPVAMAWALHPVALLVSGVHGQFDALAMLLVLLSLRCLAGGRDDWSALSLAGAVGLKSFPVLLVPFLALGLAGWRARIRYALLATAPVALILVPYVLHDAGAVRQELAGYGGVADFGWLGLVRLVRAVHGGLEPSVARYWPVPIAASKALFLAAWTALLALRARRALVPTAPASCLAVILAFLGLYGAISAQYLLWAAPLGLLVLPRAWSLAYAAACAVALAGFYAATAPALLWGEGERWVSKPAATAVWRVGVAATEVVVLAGLARVVRDARRRST